MYAEQRLKKGDKIEIRCMGLEKTMLLSFVEYSPKWDGKVVQYVPSTLAGTDEYGQYFNWKPDVDGGDYRRV